jgi:hypothetical protein
VAILSLFCSVTNILELYMIQGLHNVRMSTVMRIVKVLTLRFDNLRLDVIINFMRCFPCMEELNIKATIFSLSCFSLEYFITFLLLQLCCPEAWYSYAL